MSRNLRRWLISLGVAGVLILGVSAWWVFGRVPPPEVLPNPNGYDVLSKAGQAVVGRNSGWHELDRDALRVLVSTNAETLHLLRVGLSCECAVPIDKVIANFNTVTVDLVAFKALAQLLAAEGRLAEIEGRPAEAGRSYVDAIRLGNQVSRGGMLIHRLVGMACESVGTGPLVKLIPGLRCEQLRPLIAELERVDRHAVAWRDILRGEDRYIRAQFRNYSNPIALLKDLWDSRQQRSSQRHDAQAARLRAILLEMALRCYVDENGVQPERLDQLVPRYVQSLPLDPFTGRSLVYRRTGTNWVLYSLGPDGVDDGGKVLSRGRQAIMDLGRDDGGTDKGDIRFDSRW